MIRVIPTLALAALGLAAGLPGGPEESILRAYPASVSLETLRDFQRLLILEELPDGTWLDRTAEASIVAPDPLVRVEEGALFPLADGATTLRVSVGERELEVPVEVRDTSVQRPTSFRLDVLPIFMAKGCNVGGCHGASRGQDGFRLSLFGFDPAGDYQRLTREIPGRRVDLAFPATSLLLEKATAAVPHTGGRRFEVDSAAYRAIHSWLDEGAPDDPADVPRVTGIELSPPELTLAGAGVDIPLLVRATYSDGTDRDVTDLAVYRTSNEVTSALPERGSLRSGEPGEAFVTASFSVYTVGIPVVVLPAEGGEEYADPAHGRHPANWVDRLVEEKLKKLRISPSEICRDEVFIRRVHLDAVGRVPTPDERAAFLTDQRPSSEKRAALIDELLAQKEFSELWVMSWAELLSIRSSNDISEKAALLYFEWLRDRIAENMPVDEMIRGLLTASGGTFSAPETNFYQTERDTLVLSENVAQSLLGIRVKCAQCHNHPFDRWTQDDYYGFAAFFAQVGRKGAEDPREQIIFNRGSGEVKHPVGGKTVPPKFLGGAVPDLKGADRRSVLADWLTAAENPWFARSLANRVWAHFMGPGIVEPVDDARVSNPPSNDPLLGALADRLVETGYNFQALVRDVLNSRAYQRSAAATESNASDSRNFARATVRRVRSETLLDVICQVTEAPEKFKGLPLGSRAVQIADGSTGNYFLRTFGRSPRSTVCSCEVSFAPSLSQALHLLNGDTLQKKISGGGVVGALLDAGMTPEEVIDDLYLRCLSRPPSDEERAELVARVSAEDPRGSLEDVFWALLNSREFLFQH